LVGPIDVDDGVGKEFVVLWTLDADVDQVSLF
jgi:hypothetical protein